MTGPVSDGPTADVYRDLHEVTVKYQDLLREHARTLRAMEHMAREFADRKKRKPRRWWRR